MNFAETLLAGGAPERVCLVEQGGQQLTYAELARVSGSLAARLSELGVAHGDRVLLLSDNSFFWAASYVAILRLGAVAVPLPPTVNAGDLAHVRGVTGAR